jgi:peptide/nickel transport system substrate-binding protein
MLVAGLAEAQTLTVGRERDAPSYDPHKSVAITTAEAMFAMGDTLVALDWDMKTVRPLLAKSWTVSPDGLVYTFSLRDDVTFCSGRKMTADDVVYSVKRLVDPATKAPLGWRAGKVDDVKALDPYTVEYRLKEPFSELLNQMANFHGTVINRDNVEKLGADFGLAGFDGTGPFCWAAFMSRDHLTMKRHEAYRWAPPMYANRGPAKLERIVWKTLPEDATRVAALLTGQIQAASQLPYWAFEQLSKAPTLQMVEPQATLRTSYIGFKVIREAMSDLRVRRAINLAFDRKASARAVYFGFADPASTYVAPGALDFAPDTVNTLASFDPKAAAALLDEAGWRLGSGGFRQKDGKRLTMLLFGYTVGPSVKQLEILQGDMRKVGIYLTKTAQTDFDAWWLSYPYLSAGDAMGLYFHSANRPAPNRMQYVDPETDRLIDAGKSALTPEARAAAFQAVQRRVTDAAVWIPLAHERMFLVATKKLKDVKAHSINAAAFYKPIDMGF